MKRRFQAAIAAQASIAALLGALAATMGAPAAAQEPAAAPKPAAPAATQPELLPACTRLTFDNGLTVLLLENHELPLVDFDLVVRTGAIADPPGKEGLADVTFALLRKGTVSRNAEKIAEQLDFLGGDLDLAASHEYCRASAQFLAKDVEAGFGLVADLLLHPTFPEEELRKLIDLNVNGIKEAKDNPRQVIGDYYEDFLFRGHDFGRPVGGTETSLPTITQSDVMRFHSSYVRPNNTILAVAGDFATKDMRKHIESALGKWEKHPVSHPELAVPTAVNGRKVLLVDKPDAVQTYFCIGNVGVARGNPDDAVLDVVNTVFGGRFTSWLMSELRTKSGLSYGAFSDFDERSVPGPFVISSFTRVKDTEKAMNLALQVLDRLHEKGLSEEEIQSAKNYIRGQFPPRYETAGELAAAMAELEFYGIDRSDINDHTRKTDAVTADQVRAAIQKYYPRENLAIVMVGCADSTATVAAKYGKLERKKISDPGY